MVSPCFRSTERFIIRLGPSNPSRGITHSMHSTIYIMEMILRNIGSYGILIWIKIFSEHMLRTHNPLHKTFQFAYEVLKTARVESVLLQVFMKIVTEKRVNQRVYNHPIVTELAALLSDDSATPATIDVIVRLRPTTTNAYVLQRVPSTDSLYHLLHYVLIFPGEECRWEYGMRSIQSRSSTKRHRLNTSSEVSTTRTPGVGRKRQDLTAPTEITKLDFLKYRLHERTDEFGLFHAGNYFINSLLIAGPLSNKTA
jgi:hypothetical protein